MDTRLSQPRALRLSIKCKAERSAAATPRSSRQARHATTRLSRHSPPVTQSWLLQPSLSPTGIGQPAEQDQGGNGLRVSARPSVCRMAARLSVRPPVRPPRPPSWVAGMAWRAQRRPPLVTAAAAHFTAFYGAPPSSIRIGPERPARRGYTARDTALQLLVFPTCPKNRDSLQLPFFPVGTGRHN